MLYGKWLNYRTKLPLFKQCYANGSFFSATPTFVSIPFIIEASAYLFASVFLF